ncbi:MAG TPA: cyclic nucleotide-binding domain-containing protein, partial [Candidatus Binatia bacterium]
MAQDSSIAEHAALLARVDLFAGLHRLTLAKLAAHLVPVELAAGEELFRQGEPGDAFYLVSGGEIGVYVSGAEDGEKCVAVLRAGDPVGEMALLTSSPRSATVRAEGEGRLLRLDRAHFLKLVREEPDVLLAIAATLSRRLQAALASNAGAAAEDNIDAVAESAAAPRSLPSQSATRRRRPGRTAIGGGLAIVICLFGWLLAPPAGLSVAGWHALVLLAAAVPILAVEAIPDGILALLVCVAWVLGGIARPEVAFAGFSSASWILVVSVLAVGAAIGASGVLYRMALWMVAHTRGGFAGQVIALSVAGVIMGP